MDHRRAGLTGQLAGGDQAGQHRRADDRAALVDDEAAVGVAVERQPDVGAGLPHLGLQVGHVRRLDRVGLVVREGAVELVVHRRDVEVEVAEHGRCGVPGHPAVGVHDDREPPAGHRRQLQQELRIVLEEVALRDAARPARRRAGHPRRRGRVPASPVSTPSGTACAHILMLVVLGRVVARGEHGAGEALERPGGEVELVGRREPDQRHVGAGGGRSLGEGAGHARRGGPHVVPHDRRRSGGPGHLYKGAADGTGELVVDLVGDGAPHVVRLEDGGEGGGRGRGHAPNTIRRAGSGTPGWAARAGGRGGRPRGRRRGRCRSAACARRAGPGGPPRGPSSASASRSSVDGPQFSPARAAAPPTREGR